MFGLDEKSLKEIQSHLELRRKNLLMEGDGKADPNRSGALEVPDEDTQPYTEMNQVLTSRQNRVRAEELEKIDMALERLKEEPEEFGMCEVCDEPIKMGRLKVMPWARMCVPCKEEQADSTKNYRRRNTRDFVD